MIELRLLGPFEGSVPLPGGKPKALLARLALDPGQVIPASSLIDDLWEAPPPSAPKVLQAHVSALRKALGPDAIETRPPGYALRGMTSDLVRFETLTERAATEHEAARRAQLLREALGLWRGEPLAEFVREPFAPAAAGRLAELRLEVLTQRVDADLQLGRHDELVRELTQLVDTEPLREQLRAQLMLALYRAGRQVEALAVYRSGRRLLVDELGVEPGRRLQELERAILRQDPALDTQAPQPQRGTIVCIGCAPLALVGALEREVLVVEITSDPASLSTASSRLNRLRADHPELRTACFTSQDPVADVLRLLREQEGELLVVANVAPELLAAAPCDVALLAEPSAFEPRGALLVPFGGQREEWRALELAGWLARAHDLPVRLLGVEASAERRDASRLLAAASLALQRFSGIAAEPVIVPPGAAGVLAEASGGAAIVASLPHDGPDAARRELLEGSPIPVILVHGGRRPSGLAPDRTMTRFSWSIAPTE
jgi:DNA-binding SARP family transcriptional activator